MPAALAKIAEASEAELNETITRHMLQLGIPEEMVGYTVNRQQFNAFTRETLLGGSNMPSRYGAKPGISVDQAVLDPRFPLVGEKRVKAWETASLWDRIDAVIAHEYTEALAKTAPSGWNVGKYGVWDQHKHAVMFAAEQARAWHMSQRTIDILEETARLSKLTR